MGKIGLIIRREYESRVKKKSFLLMTILGPILFVGLIVGAIVAGQTEEGTYKVMVVDDTYSIATSGETPFPVKSSRFEQFVFWEKDGNGEAIMDAKYAFKNDETYDLLIWIPHTVIQSTDSEAKLFYKKKPSLRVLADLERMVNLGAESIRLEHHHIDKDTYKLVRNRVSLSPISIDQEEADQYMGLKTVLALIFSVCIYMFVLLYGVQVMRGVIEEKSSRIVEVIISSVKPFELMMGKIIGIMLVGLTQFIIWIGLTFTLTSIAQGSIIPANQYDASNIVAEQGQEAIQIAEVNTMDQINAVYDFLFHQTDWLGLLGLFIIYFIGGYLLYGALMAAVGSAVDSETDTQQFMMPITIPLICGIIIASMSLENPNSPALFWASHIPLTSPIAMMVRVVMEGPSALGWELVISIAILIGSFIGTTWLASKIYRTGILMYGKKTSYKEIFKWLRHK